jgi:fermentation-respiration switch protein FrsA (DUF1100 family)
MIPRAARLGEQYGPMATGARTVRALIAALIVAALLLAALWVFQRRLIYLPDSSMVPPAGQVLAGAQDVRLATSDGLELGAWYVPAAGADRGVTVLVANGNAGNRADRAPLAAALAKAGFATLLFDYRGYGGNSGNPSEDGLALDVRAAHRYLTAERQVPQGRLLYFGESLGAGVVTDLALEHPPAGMLLRSPFTDLAAVGQLHYPFLPVRLLLRDRYPVAHNVARIDVPTTIVYGTADKVVPPEHSEQVAAAALGPVQLVALPGAGHNDAAMLAGEHVVGALEALSSRVTSR